MSEIDSAIRGVYRGTQYVFAYLISDDSNVGFVHFYDHSQGIRSQGANADDFRQKAHECIDAYWRGFDDVAAETAGGNFPHIV
jgi:hypothetical protein